MAIESQYQYQKLGRREAVLRALAYDRFGPKEPTWTRSSLQKSAPRFLRYWTQFGDRKDRGDTNFNQPLPPDIFDPVFEADRFTSCLDLKTKRFCLLNETQFGWVPNETGEGDIIAMLSGGEMFYVLRPIATGEHRLVGDCYLQGLMRGEASNEPTTTITII